MEQNQQKRILTKCERINVMQENLRDMAEDACMVGWFGGRLHEPVFPLHRLELSLIWYYKSRNREVSKQINLPAIYHDAVTGDTDGTIRIGGPGWSYFLREGKICYTRTGSIPDAEPVGDMRNAFTDSYSVDSFGRPRPIESCLEVSNRMLTQAEFMLQPKHTTPDDSTRFPEATLKAPRFLAPVVPYAYLQLRRGQFLDNLVLACARNGSWPILLPSHRLPNSMTPERGTVEKVDTRSVLFNCEQYSYRETFKAEMVQREIENLILFAFGVRVALHLETSVTSKQLVPKNSPMFSPVPKREWTMQELRAHPMYDAMQYMACLTTAGLVNRTYVVDHATAFSAEHPFVNFEDMSALVQKMEYPYRFSPSQRVPTHPLMLEAPGVSINLASTSIEAFVRNQRARIAQSIAEEKQKRRQEKDLIHSVAGNTIEPAKTTGLVLKDATDLEDVGIPAETVNDSAN